jgi:hypothetical protein
MKRYAAWGVDKSYRWRWLARLAGWWYWRKRAALAKANELGVE